MSATPLERAAIAYVRAVRSGEPGTMNAAYRDLSTAADRLEKRIPTPASKLPDARAVMAAAMPDAGEVTAMPEHLKRTNGAHP